MLSYTKSIICFFTFCFSMIYHHCIVNILFPRNLYNTSVNFFSVKFLPNVAEPKPSHRMHRPIYYAHCARAEIMCAFERVTVIGAKGAGQQRFQPSSVVYWLQPHTDLSWIRSSLLTSWKHHNEKSKSVSYIKLHLIIMEVMLLRFRFAYVLLFQFSLKQSRVNFILMFPGVDNGDI